MNEDKKISTQEIIETLNIQNANKNESVKGDIEFSRKADGILNEYNEKSKKTKLIFGISLSVALFVLIILALFVPSCARLNKL